MIAVEKTKRVLLSQLKPYPGNPRRGDVAAIVESLKAHGQYRALVVNARTSEILAGNHTFRALEELGADEALVHFVDVDEDQAARITLVDNRSNDVASYDDAALLELLGSLPDLDGTGYSAADLEALLPAETSGDTEPVEPPGEPRTKPGDLWLLGEHRLLCGDAFDAASLDCLYGDAKVGCVLTDPPYGINLDTDYSRITGSKKSTVKGRVHGIQYRAISGDAHPFDASLLATYFAKVKEQFWFGANYYRRTLSADDLDGSWLVWDKRNEGSDPVIGSAFELIWSRTPHKQDMLRHLWTGFTARNRGGSREHPAEKPIVLLGDLLERWVPDACIVADPFAGSGTTLIACENLNRRCYAMEIDPRYCDVIVDRWERHTGKTATRADG